MGLQEGSAQGDGVGRLPGGGEFENGRVGTDCEKEGEGFPGKGRVLSLRRLDRPSVEGPRHRAAMDPSGLECQGGFLSISLS